MKSVLILLIGEVLEDPRVYKTATSLAGSGVAVTVACTNPSTRPAHETVDGLTICRFPHRTEYYVKRLYHWLSGKLHPNVSDALGRGHEDAPSSQLKSFLKNAVLSRNFRHFMRSNMKINKAMISEFSDQSFDLIHCNDVDTLFAGTELKKRGAASHLLYDSHEYWSGIGAHGRQANDMIREIEECGIKAADFVVTVNPIIANELQEQYGLEQTPSVILNCPYRTDSDSGIATIAEPVKVIYQGKLQAFRGLPELIVAFRNVENAELTLSGYGPLEDSLKHLCRSLGLSKKVLFTGRYKPKDTLPILSGHDIGVMPFRDVTLNIRYTSPNKMFDYAMAGLALAGSDFPFLRSTINAYDMGRLFNVINSDSIASVLNEMIADKEALLRYKANSRKAALETFCWEEQFWQNYPWEA